MKRLLAALAVVSGLVLGARALADVTYLSANAVVDSVTFASEIDGGVSFSVCGHVSPMGNSPTTACSQPVDLPAGAGQTAVLAIFSGAGLTRYKNVNGL